MKKLALITFLTIGFFSMSQTRTSVSDGDWNDPNTWSPTGVPTSGDSVFINHEVTQSENIALVLSYLSISENGSLLGDENLEFKMYSGDVVNYGLVDLFFLRLEQMDSVVNYNQIQVDTLICMPNNELKNSGTLDFLEGVVRNLVNLDEVHSNGFLCENFNNSGVVEVLNGDGNIGITGSSNYVSENSGSIASNVLSVDGDFENVGPINCSEFIVTNNCNFSNEGILNSTLTFMVSAGSSFTNQSTVTTTDLLISNSSFTNLSTVNTEILTVLESNMTNNSSIKSTNSMMFNSGIGQVVVNNTGNLECEGNSMLFNAGLGQVVVNNSGNLKCAGNITFSLAEINNNGHIKVVDTLTVNSTNVSGTGNICIEDYSMLTSSSFEGAIDFCDQEGTIEMNFGTTFGPNTTMCGVNSCAPVSGVGMEQINLDDAVVIFPNPTNGELNIQLEKEIQLEKLRVYSSTGKLVVEKRELNIEKIDLNHVQSGTYFLVLETEQGNSTKLFVKY